MSNLQSQASSHKANVLRLKELLDWIRQVVVKVLPGANPTSREVSQIFGVKLDTARCFWDEQISGGPLMIKAIRAKIGEDRICEEILTLLDITPDTYKSLIPYPAPAIELTFDVFDAFVTASNQAGVTRRNQMKGEQFAAFFGQHYAFVYAITMRNRQVLKAYNAELDSQVRAVLKATDWTKVRPMENAKPAVLAGKHAQLRELIAQVRSRYPSDYAMLEALPAHKDSLKNALAGKGKPSVLDELLRKARKLVAKFQEIPAALPETKVEVKEPQTFVGSYISALNSFIRMSEAAGLDPQAFTDGHRDSLIRIMVKLATFAGIDAAYMKRLQSVEGLAVDDPRLESVLSAMRGAKR